MLRTAQNIRNVITIFHSPKIESSVNLVKYAKQRLSDPEMHKFDLQIDEGNPTSDQLNILKDLSPLLKSVKSPESIPRPTLVSWFNGKVAVDNETRAKAIINSADSEVNGSDN